MNNILDTTRQYNSEYMWLNDLTKEMDKHYIKELKSKRENSGWYKKYYITYLVNADTINVSEDGKMSIMIRSSGDTRGYIELDDDNVIIGYKLYDNSYKHNDKIDYCYKKSVKNIIDNFIGDTIYINNNSS